MRIEQGARIIVENWIHAQPEDVIHFITDETKLREAEAFTYATRQIGAIPKLTVLPSDSIQAGDSIEQMRNIMSTPLLLWVLPTIPLSLPTQWIMLCATVPGSCRFLCQPMTEHPCWNRIF